MGLQASRPPAQGAGIAYLSGQMIETARLDALEFKCAHLEKAVQELSDVVYRQQQQLDRAVLRNQELASQIESLETVADAAGGPRVEIPPHY